MGKRKKKGAPAIVPRFLKSAVTIGAIPALAVACAKPVKPPPPVVAYMAPPEPMDAMRPPPPVVAAYALDAQPPIQPVVAAYASDAGPVQPNIPPAVVAAYVGNKIPVAVDAGVDAAPAKKKKAPRPDAALPPPPVVAAMVRPPPPVVAAMMPRDTDVLDGAPPKKKSPKKP